MGYWKNMKDERTLMRANWGLLLQCIILQRIYPNSLWCAGMIHQWWLFWCSWEGPPLLKKNKLHFCPDATLLHMLCKLQSREFCLRYLLVWFFFSANENGFLVSVVSVCLCNVDHVFPLFSVWMMYLLFGIILRGVRSH